MSAGESAFPFPDDSPLGRATHDPVSALALLAEAVSRKEKEIEPYLIAASAAIGYVREHGFIFYPPESEPLDVAEVLTKPDAPSPHVLYEQTGGGETYRREMIRYGYVLVKGDVRCMSKAETTVADVKEACRCLLKQGHDGAHMCPHGEWPAA